MNKWNSFGLLSLGLLLLVLFGCVAPMSYQGEEATGEIPREKATGEIPLSAMQRFDDIPVPGTFNFDSQNSYVFENELNRVGVLKYTTTTSPDDVVAFFKREMPNAGWKLINILEYGQKILTYEKEGESCIINVLPGRIQSTVTISVTPNQYGGSYSRDKEK